MRQAVVFCGCQQSIFSEADSPKQQLQPLTELRVITDPAYKNIYRSISADRWCYCANYDQAHYMWSTFTGLLPHEELPEVCCCHKENNNMFIFPALPRVLILMFFRELCKQTHKIYWEDVSECRQPACFKGFRVRLTQCWLVPIRQRTSRQTGSDDKI